MLISQLTFAVLPVVFFAFLVSATVGLGGSLVLVPVLVVALGAKQGVALASLLLAANNCAKLVAYRRTVPWRASVVVVALTILGSVVGASLLTAAPERVVEIAVIAALVLSLVGERYAERVPARVDAGVLAL
jgi:hypothetical protein